MPRWWTAIAFGVWLLAAVGCGDPAPKPLTPDEEKQFEEQRQKERQQEKREPMKPPKG
jgi:hypothetical protein